MYQVWTKATYEEAWRLAEVVAIQDVEGIIREHFGTDVEVMVSLPVKVKAEVTVEIDVPKDKESTPWKGLEKTVVIPKGGNIEAPPSGPENDQGTGTEGQSPVRRRAPGSVQKVD